MQITSASALAASAAQAQSTADLLAQSILYSASAGGRTFPAEISLSAGLYTGLVPQLPGITASGNSLLVAESNLNARISIFV